MDRQSSSLRQKQEAEGYRRELRIARLRGLLMQREVEASAAQMEELSTLQIPLQ